MNIKEIIIKYLNDNDFDGLWCEECACIKEDLMNCCDFVNGGPTPECEPGYLQECPETCGEHDWHIGKKKYSLTNQQKAFKTREKFKSFEDDWNAPGMEEYDKL